MKKCCRSVPASRPNPVIQPKMNSQRDCCCSQGNSQPKNNVKVGKTNPQTFVKSKSYPVTSTANKKVSCACQEENQTQSKRKTWLEVLSQNPRKVANANPCKSDVASSNTLERQQETTRRIGEEESTREIGEDEYDLLTDENFLWKLMEINRAIQAACARAIEQKNAVNQAKFNRFQASENPRRDAASSKTNPRNIPITDDDKFNQEKSRNARKFSRSTEENARQNLQVKALVKLLESMQSVTNNTEAQRRVLQHLMDVIVQLRDENNVLNKLKDIRIELESKLASLSTENVYLKSKLQTVESERDQAKNLLKMKDRENERLKKHILTIKETIAGKLDSGINYDVDDYSFELNNLNNTNTVASVPSNNESFDALIRPASSSPTEDVEKKWENRVQKHEDEDSGIQSNLIDNLKTSNEPIAKDQENVLSELQNNVKKTLQDLQNDLKLNDVSLNLSRDTYKLSSSLLQ